MTARIVLFDLDGTVLTFDGAPPGPGRTALDCAMRDLHAFEKATDGIRVAGGTDRALARAMLRRAGIHDDDDAIERVIECYLERLEADLQVRRYRPIGDVVGTVCRLRERGVTIGIATGNVRRGAAMKLASAGLTAAFALDHGGFGCDAEPRAEIVRVAAERCGAVRTSDGTRGAFDVIVVGDTEHDVRAGRAIGARVVGLATDDESRAELIAAGADAIVDACGEALIDEVLR